MVLDLSHSLVSVKSEVLEKITAFTWLNFLLSTHSSQVLPFGLYNLMSRLPFSNGMLFFWCPSNGSPKPFCILLQLNRDLTVESHLGLFIQDPVHLQIQSHGLGCVPVTSAWAARERGDASCLFIHKCTWPQAHLSLILPSGAKLK